MADSDGVRSQHNLLTKAVIGGICTILGALVLAFIGWVALSVQQQNTATVRMETKLETVFEDFDKITARLDLLLKDNYSKVEASADRSFVNATISTLRERMEMKDDEHDKQLNALREDVAGIKSKGE